jgi:outer membrane lipopolysaccharide assembly protein LptE/RlpB
MDARHQKGVRPAAFALLLLVAIAGSGCGYRLETVHGGRFADPRLRIDLEPFRNLSFEADAGSLMAVRVREELRRNGFKGEFVKSGADCLVEGTVRQVRDDVSSHSADGFALEHALTLTVDIRVVEVVKGRLLLKEEGIAETAAYFAGPDFQYTEANRRMAFEELCRRVSRRLGRTLRMVL